MASQKNAEGDDSRWLVIANYVIAAQGGLTGPIVARLLGPDGRGVSATIQTTYYIVGVLASLGVALALNGRSSVESSSALWEGSRNIRRAIFLSSLLIVPAVYISARSVDFGQVGVLALVVFVMAFLNPVTVVKSGIFIAKGNYRKLFLGRLIGAAVLILGLLFLALIQSASVLNVTALYILTSSAVAFVPLARSASPTGDAIIRVKQNLNSEAPSLTLAGVLSASNGRLDQVILPVTMSHANLGYYAVAVSYGGLTAPLGSALAMVAMRRTAASGTASNPSRRSIALLLISTVGLGGVAALAVPALFGQEFKASISASVVMCAATLMTSFVAVVAGQLVAIGAPSSIIPGELIALACIPLCLPLSILFGPLGAAIASCICYGSNLLTLIWFRRRFRRKVKTIGG